MTTTIVKWGNSRGVRLPRYLLESTGLKDNDPVEIVMEKESIVIRKIVKPRVHRTLKDRLAGFKGTYIGEEWDSGKPVGKNV